MSVIITTPEQFPAQMRRVLKKDVPNWQVSMHKKIHSQVDRGMVMGTPVGNAELWQPQSKPPPPGYAGGRARGNWQASTGWPVAGEVDRVDPSGNATIQANQAALAGLRPYGRSFETNNVPYINDLNDRPNPYHPGKAWSPQAPLQWMEGVLDAVVAAFNRDAL